MIEVTSLTKRFGDRTVLNGVSLLVEPGKVVAILGPSGSGKSTLLRCINLLTIPDQGSIRVGHRRLQFDGIATRLPSDREQAAFRADTGMVFQHFNLFPHLTVLQNVMEGPLTVRRAFTAAAREQAMALLAKVGLLDFAAVFPDRLSGGQKQRVAIARALAMQPTVMLFDEATSALDPVLVDEVLKVIEALAREGMTMILVTHEISFARDVADHIIFMRDGRVIESGPPDQLIDHPKDESTAAFLARFHRRWAAS